jgi:hypothetical protein
VLRAGTYYEEAAVAFVLCSDFTIFPDNHQLGPTFTLSGMDFQDAPGAGAVSFVNQTASVNGLQFPDTGIDITLPVTVGWARLNVGQFASPLSIESFDSGGSVIQTYSLNKPNSYYFLNFTKGDIAFIRLIGGGNEGVIVSICIFVS